MNPSTNPEYHYGDRVVFIVNGTDDGNFHIHQGMKGTVIDSSTYGRTHIGVEFDDNIHGHDCSGNGRGDHCWYVIRKHIALVDDDLDPCSNIELAEFLFLE